MTVTSNSYAEKVFSEHPIALWPLDEESYYVSLISETSRTISTANGWTITGATPGIFGGIPGESLPLPVFSNSVRNKFTLGSTFSTPATIAIESPILVNDINDLNQEIGNISVGAFFYPFSEVVDIEIGIEYTDNSTGTPITNQRLTQGYHIDNAEQWAFLSGVFDLPTDFSDIKIVFDVSVVNPSEGDQVLIHGITIGQWSEQFQVESLGIIPQALPDSIVVDGLGTAASVYGLQDASGYYMVRNNSLCAKNSGLPMVFGAENSTVITPNNEIVIEQLVTYPSMILPGYGFMNQNGQYSELTLEMWLSIQSSSTVPQRIVGPVASEDGLYVNDSFLVLKVGEYSGSYYVGEWDRPMLVAIRVSSSQAELVINGEEVITLLLDPALISYPAKTDLEGFDQDWIGFFAYDDVPVILVDCVGIYPYKVPNIVEKRRWVYGQGVESRESISGSNLGTTVAIDYTFANYAKNYLYPDIGRWNQGVQENIVVDTTTMSLPQYSLPTLSFTNKTMDQWYQANENLSALFGTYISLKPSESWSSTDGYMMFPNLNLLQQDLKAFYALMESVAGNTSKQTLLYLENQVTGESFEVTLEDDTTQYIYRYPTSDANTPFIEEMVHEDTTHTLGEFIFVGLAVDRFAQYAGGRVAQFFGSKQQLRLYVGGRPNFTQTFAGNIYRVGFCTARNLEKISNLFASTGLPVGYNAIDQLSLADGGNQYFGNNPLYINPSNGEAYWSDTFDGGDEYFGNSSEIFADEVDGGGVYSLLVSYILEHVASYTITPKIFLNNFMLDIGVNSYWQDYLPLSYFAKYVTDGTLAEDGVTQNTKLDLDFIQFNIDYPVINRFISKSYDSTSSIVRTYVSFQELSDAPNIGTNNYTKIILPPKSGVVAPSNGEWQSRNTVTETVSYTKYEVVNGTIIYPPSDISFEQLGMVVHVEIISNGIMENPVVIKSLQLSSQALNSFVPNAIGTKFGSDVYPYRKSSELYDYKGRNPFTIYKKSSPYFYLTSDSGLQLRNFYDGDIQRGIEIPINKNVSSFYKASAWQMAVRYNEDTFPERVTEIFELYGKSLTKENAGDPNYLRHIKFYMKPDDGTFKRGRIYAIDAQTGLEVDNITFYINGRKVHNPVIDSKVWAIIGFTFTEPIDFSGYPGYLSITGPILFNNVSHYQISEADEASRSVYRKWFAIKTVEGTDETWDYWKTLDGDLALPGTQTFTWQNVLFISSAEFMGVNGKTIYRKYTGTDRIIVDSESEFRINGYEYLPFKDISWQTSVIKPA